MATLFYLYIVSNETSEIIEYLFKNPTWPTEWHFHLHILVWEDFMYTGKDDYLQLYYDSLKSIINNVSVNNSGLILNKNGNDMTRPVRIGIIAFLRVWTNNTTRSGNPFARAVRT